MPFLRVCFGCPLGDNWSHTAHIFTNRLLKPALSGHFGGRHVCPFSSRRFWRGVGVYVLYESMPTARRKPVKAGGARLIISCARVCVYFLAPTAVPGVHNRVFICRLCMCAAPRGALAVSKGAYAARVFFEGLGPFRAPKVRAFSSGYAP